MTYKICQVLLISHKELSTSTVLTSLLRIVLVLLCVLFLLMPESARTSDTLPRFPWSALYSIPTNWASLQNVWYKTSTWQTLRHTWSNCCCGSGCASSDGKPSGKFWNILHSCELSSWLACQQLERRKVVNTLVSSVFFYVLFLNSLGFFSSLLNYLSILSCLLNFLILFLPSEFLLLLVLTAMTSRTSIKSAETWKALSRAVFMNEACSGGKEEDVWLVCGLCRTGY